MKKQIKILIFTITLALSFVLSGCSSSVNNTQKTPAKKTRTTNKTPVINSTSEDDNELTQDSSLLPLTLEAIEAGTIFIFEKENRKLFIQRNNGVIQAAYSSIPVEPGDKICFYGYDYDYKPGHNLKIQCTGDCYVYGNVMSLLEFTAFAGKKEIKKQYAFLDLFKNNNKIKNHETLDIVLPATTLAGYCYLRMFSGCTGLTDAPELPATSLADSCYYSMFSGCTSLTEAPELPATSLASSCYFSMFSDCTGLTEAPELPATSLAGNCYYSMFSGCTDLTKAPELPATTLDSSCYNSMFSGCTSLTEAPELPATTLAGECYHSMFLGCTGLTKAPELPATTLATRCYYSMFSACTSLTEAPDLPATTLADYCYYSMFKDCTNLKSITCLATTRTATLGTGLWLVNVSATGTFVKAEGTSWGVGINGLPEGWTTQDYVAP